MRKRKIQNLIASLVIVIALVVLYFHDEIWEAWRLSTREDSRPVIAKLENPRKGVNFRFAESLTYFSARDNMDLRAKDTVSTGEDSTAVITFKTGLQVEVQPNSLIIVQDITQGEGTLELTFLKGRIKVVNKGKGESRILKGSLIKKTKNILLEDKVLPPPIKVGIGLDDDIKPTPSLPDIELEEKRLKAAEERRKKRERAKKKKKKTKVAKETLSNSYITSVVRKKKPFINRCYTQHLRLNPKARGRIDTSLTIQPDGTISAARVVGSTIADPTLQQCVISTLKRARFKSFDGDPLIVRYPINFD